MAQNAIYLIASDAYLKKARALLPQLRSQLVNPEPRTQNLVLGARLQLAVVKSRRLLLTTEDRFLLLPKFPAVTGWQAARVMADWQHFCH